MSGALLIIPSQTLGYPRFEASPTFGLHNFLCRLDYDISYICAKISSTKSWSDKEEDCSNFRVGILHMFQQHFHSFSSILPLQQFRLIALKSPQIRQTPLNLQNPLSPPSSSAKTLYIHSNFKPSRHQQNFFSFR